MKTTRPLSLAAAIALGAAACESGPTVDLRRVERLDAGPDAAPETDLYRGSDARPARDAERDAEPADAAAVDAAADVGTDAVVDALVVDAALPPPAPTPDRVAVLPKRNGMRVAWLFDGRLHRVCVPATADAAECGAAELPGSETSFAQVGHVVGPLRGVNTTSGTPWVFHAEAESGEVLGWNLASALIPAPRPLRTRLFAPFNVGLFGARTLVVGALEPGGARLGFALVDNGVVSAPVADESGLALPPQIVGTREAAVFAYPTGQCVSVESASANGQNVQGRLSWRCGLGLGGALAAADSNASALMAATRDPATGRVALRADGFALPLGADGQPQAGTTLRAYADVLDSDYNGLLRGRVVRTSTFDPPAHTAWALRPGGVIGAPIDDLGAFLGFAVSADGAQRLLLSWDADAFSVRLSPVPDEALERVDVPNIAPAPAACAAGRRVERCDGLDDECDGQADDGLCCPVAGVLASATLPEPEVNQIGFVGRMDTDLAAFFLQGERIYFATTPFAGGEPAMRVRADWQGYRTLGAAAVLGPTTAVTLATPWPAPAPPPSEPPTGAPSEPPSALPSEPPSGAPSEPPSAAPEPAPALLWVVDGVGLAPRATPCAPVLAIAPMQAPERLRVFCPEGAVDLLPGEVNAAPVPMPQGEALRWVAVAHEGVQNRLLVARGDAFDLEVWTNEAEPTRDDAPLPALLSNLVNTERTRPVHVAGLADARPARVSEDGRLQVLLTDGPTGWYTMPGVAVPRGVDISSHAPLAISWGEVYRDAFEARVVVTAHDLRPGAQPWGTRLRAQVDRDFYTDEEVQTFALPDHPAGAGLPDLYRFVGQLAVLEGVGLDCR